MRRKRAAIVLGMSCILMASAVLQGCQQNPKSGKVEIELVQYNPTCLNAPGPDVQLQRLGRGGRYI